MIELHGQITQVMLRGSLNVVPSDGSAGVIDTSDATATAGDIAEGKTAYVTGGKVTGNVATYTDFASYSDASAKGLSDGIRLSKTISQDSLLRSGTEIRMVSDISNFGDATAADVAAGKTFTSAAGLKVTGTRVDLDTSDATATAGDIAKDKTAYVNGEKVTGTIRTKSSGENYLPTSTTNAGTTQMKLTAEIGTDILMRSGSSITLTEQLSNLGDAEAEDVAEGKTFTSSAGLKVTGTHKCETPSGTIEITTNGTHDVTNYASAEVNVPTNGIDTSDATATASQILKDKTAYVNGEKVTGSLDYIPNGSITAASLRDATIHTSRYDGVTYLNLKRTFTSPIAYLKDALVSFGTPIDNFGDATASDVAEGKTFTSSAGLKATGTMQSKAAATYTPGTSDQTIASGQYLSGAQTIKGDSNLVAGNIKSGVSIFGVAGTYTGSGGSSSGIQAQRITSASETITISGSGTVKVWGYGFKSSQVGGTTYAFVGDGYYFGSYGTPSKTSLTFSISNGKLSGLPAGLTALDVLVTIGVS